MYQPESWVPKQKPLQVFLVQLTNLEDIKILLGATSIRQAYNRNKTIVIEWTMMHRETFSALVGQYIVRNERGEFQVMDPDELRTDFQPYIEEAKVEKVSLSHPELGRLVAFDKNDEGFTSVVFELPDGSPAEFVVRRDEAPIEEVKNDREENRPVPGPKKQHNNHQNNRPNRDNN
jgi:hypothetical protein